MKLNLGSIEIEIAKGDIANQPELEAIVNAANAKLAPGGGVAGAIHAAAGPVLYKECRHLEPIKPGEAVLTSAYNLPNKFVIHCLGPVYGRDKPESELLANCYRNSIRIAEEAGITSIGFPGISTGIFGYPSNLAVEVAFNTVLAELPRIKNLKKIKFVVFNTEDLQLYHIKLKKISAG
ncbi:macro domain-containing protein [Gramella sp. MAR_2010_147]|uniref:macro domain-containing protein n=1 Tax=Gramella sp. MAR_2010_147 TaxID=1250205 RepID=UPI00087D6D5D|nr:macro domain-containing protein [Gramella sp. MAR_2010_147]SDS42461.1 O-acetyl-ADP-ribose deacetylase (regulator of RNase III), contains Macro domain [Gramella sp. MAR_2010_147]